MIYQDNESAILLEKNGKLSSGKQTRHIEIRFFLLTDNVDKGKINIEYCPTEKMIADFFTKPLQGHLFHRFKAVVLGHQHTNSLQSIIAHSFEERVEERDDQLNSDNGNCLKELVSDNPEPEWKPKRVTFSPTTYADAVKQSVRRKHSKATTKKQLVANNVNPYKRIILSE